MGEMTAERLEEIRARCEADTSDPRDWGVMVAGAFRHDIPALLAEVERLRACLAALEAVPPVPAGWAVLPYVAAININAVAEYGRDRDRRWSAVVRRMWRSRGAEIKRRAYLLANARQAREYVHERLQASEAGAAAMREFIEARFDEESIRQGASQDDAEDAAEVQALRRVLSTTAGADRLARLDTAERERDEARAENARLRPFRDVLAKLYRDRFEGTCEDGPDDATPCGDVDLCWPCLIRETVRAACGVTGKVEEEG